MRQRITIGTTSFEILQDLGGGTFHDSLLLDHDGTKVVLKHYKGAYAGELERQWARWHASQLGVGGSELVGYLEAGTFEGRPYLLRRWIDAEPFDAFARRLKVKTRPRHRSCTAACRARSASDRVASDHSSTMTGPASLLPTRPMRRHDQCRRAPCCIRVSAALK